MKKDAPYPVVYEDHDGSWTWSIEIGEPFEDDHRVLATDYGYPDRREAGTALKLAMPEVVDQLASEKQASLDQRQRKIDQDQDLDAEATQEIRSSAPNSELEPEPSADENTTTLGLHALPDWGVFEKSTIVALFSCAKLAKDYAADRKGMSVKRIEFAVSAREIN